MSAVHAHRYHRLPCNYNFKTIPKPLQISRSFSDLDIFRCWALGASLGGAGHERSNHRQQEFDQFKDCVAAIKFSLDCFLGDEEGKMDGVSDVSHLLV